MFFEQHILNAVFDAVKQTLRISSPDVVDQLKTLNGMIPNSYDYVGVAYPSDTTEVYTFKTGGVSGTTVCTITITYTNNTKAALSSAVRT